MKYGSVCSGIEAATRAWHELGWEAQFYSEIEPFPRAVLEHHYPNTPLHGDFTTIKDGDYGAIDLLTGGTPCQSFSIAGLRKGIEDDRGNLTLEFIRLAERLGPKWLVWENVPGVLSSNEGKDFGSLLGGLAECGYGFAYRILDAQYFGVPQRRRRVVLIGYLGDWRPPAEVLFEPESLRGNITPSREKGERIASNVKECLASGCDAADQIAKCLTARGAGGQNLDPETANFVIQISKDVAVPLCFKERQGCEGGGKGYMGKENQAYTVSTSQDQNIFYKDIIRRFTPLECERLQGFPDNYTLVPYRGKPATDGVRYKAIGNSWAVPKFKWIGERIQSYEKETTK